MRHLLYNPHGFLLLHQNYSCTDWSCTDCDGSGACTCDNCDTEHECGKCFGMGVKAVDVKIKGAGLNRVMGCGEHGCDAVGCHLILSTGSNKITLACEAHISRFKKADVLNSVAVADDKVPGEPLLVSDVKDMQRVGK